MSIWRAINLKRLVAFTGSGTSTIYGLPAWSELPHTYAGCVNEQIKATIATEEKRYKRQTQTLNVRLKELKRRIRPTLDQINAITCDLEKPKDVCEADRYSIRFSKPYTGDVLTFFALCDEVLERLPDDEDAGLTRRFKARAAFGQTVRVGEAGVIRDNLMRLLRTQLHGPNDSKTLSPYRRGAKEGRYLRCVKMVIDRLAAGSLEDLKGDDAFLKRLYRSSLPPKGPEILFGSLLEDNREDSPRDTIKTLMRFDDPDNMILAGADYVSLYEEKSVARDSFNNAQRALFDGNDVLFVGDCQLIFA